MKRLLIGVFLLLMVGMSLACDVSTSSTLTTPTTSSVSTTTGTSGGSLTSSVTTTWTPTFSDPTTSVTSTTETEPTTSWITTTTGTLTTTTTTPFVTTTTTSATTTISEDLTDFQSVHGFAQLGITDRTGITAGTYVVEDEIAFLDALSAPDVQIIEIAADLDLGYLEVSAQFLAAGRNVSEVADVYRKHSHEPMLHPTLLASGVGRILLVGFDGLMIYSKNGSTLKHVAFSIDTSTDIVVRNLVLDELWEWDESTEGDYDVNDWDYFTIEDASGIWFDHLEFHRSYDGLIDIKSGVSLVTLSWSRLVFEPDAFIETQMEWLETHIAANPYYETFRTDYGVSAADMVEYASCQKKGFNFGNTTDGSGFESISVTFHHLYVKNLCDRFPRLRKGDVHLYHCILDNTDITAYNTTHGGKDLTNQGIVTTEGGAVLMENCIFIHVAIPIKNHQDSDPSEAYSGEYLVLASEMRKPSVTWVGSSEEAGTLWIHAGSYAKLPFGFRNYAEIPYDYSVNDVYYLNETLAAFPPGTAAWENFDWLTTNRIDD